MKTKIAVITVSGKAYYFIVKELKKKKTPFLSLTPRETIPFEIKVVLTTDKEKHLIQHSKILVYNEKTDPEKMIYNAIQLAQGKEHYEQIIIGVDPGAVFGLAVLADGNVVETGNSYSVEALINEITTLVKNFQTSSVKSFTVRIGDGLTFYTETLLTALDQALPSNVIIESVSEKGTNRYLSKRKHKRELRDIISAVNIANREGQLFSRRKK